MSTHALIGVREGEEVIYIYCNFDGYPDGVGAELQRNYSSRELATDLIYKGDVSTICGKVDTYVSRGEKWENIMPKQVDKKKYNLSLGKKHKVDYMYLFNDKKGWEIKCCYGYGIQTNFEDE